MLEHEDIKAIKLISTNSNVLFDTKIDDTCLEKLTEYKSVILDTINNKKVADLYIYYSNQHMEHFNHRIFIILTTTFIFSLLIFLTVFFYIRYDLIALRNIANALKEYSKTKDTKRITQSSRSKEISIIANVANEMFVNIAEYVQRLKSFNLELEKRVKEEIDKQQNQEKNDGPPITPGSYGGDARIYRSPVETTVKYYRACYRKFRNRIRTWTNK